MAAEDSNPWIYAGLASSFPNIEPDTASTNRKTKLSTTTQPCDADCTSLPPCKIIQPTETSEQAQELTPDEAQTSIGLKPQVLVFRYRNKLHAVDHACPHRTYPLSRGAIYDIEDFGIVLSAGISCPKHGWAFDLHTGEADRGMYRLGLWEVETRAVEKGQDEEVWVRRKVKARKLIG